MGYRLFLRPPTFWFVYLGFGVVGLWSCVLCLWGVVGLSRLLQIAPDSSRTHQIAPSSSR